MDKQRIKRQVRLGKQVNFLNRLDEVLKKDAIPELISQADSHDFDQTVRMASLLNDTSDFLKEFAVRQARIEEEMNKIVEMLENQKKDNAVKIEVS